jgi:anti-sigma B factor antagonist
MADPVPVSARTIATPATHARLTLAVHRVGRRAVVEVGGEVDLGTAPALAEALQEVVDAGTVELWLDLSPTAFIDSTGLHLVLDLRTQLAAMNRRLAIICPDGPIRRTFEVVGLDRVLPLHASRATAQRAG